MSDHADSHTPTLPLSRSSMAWKVNAEPTVFLIAGRALLMQVAHPGVGYGVEQHSTYASDPWGRLFSTGDIMMKLSFGTPEQVRRQQKLLAAKHRRVQGVTDDGTPYRALDGDLLLWVWATLVDSALMMYELVRRPLCPAELARYYAESKLTAHASGVASDAVPSTWGDFVDYFDGVVRRDLRVTDAARAVAVATAAFPVPLPAALSWALGAPTRAITTATLPESVRGAYGFTLDRRTQRRYAATMAALRVASAVQPEVVRQLPASTVLSRSSVLSIPPLQRVGGRITTSKIRAAGFEPGRSGQRSARTKANVAQ